MIKTCLLFFCLILPGEVLSQQTTYRDSAGRYVGSSYTSNSRTSYRSPTGRVVARSSTIGKRTYYYGPVGQYRGSSYGKNKSFFPKGK